MDLRWGIGILLTIALIGTMVSFDDYSDKVDEYNKDYSIGFRDGYNIHDDGMYIESNANRGNGYSDGYISGFEKYKLYTKSGVENNGSE